MLGKENRDKIGYQLYETVRVQLAEHITAKVSYLIMKKSNYLIFSSQLSLTSGSGVWYGVLDYRNILKTV